MPLSAQPFCCRTSLEKITTKALYLALPHIRQITKEQTRLARTHRLIQYQLDKQRVSGYDALEHFQPYNKRHVGKPEDQRPSVDNFSRKARAANRSLNEDLKNERKKERKTAHDLKSDTDAALLEAITCD